MALGVNKETKSFTLGKSSINDSASPPKVKVYRGGILGIQAFYTWAQVIHYIYWTSNIGYRGREKSVLFSARNSSTFCSNDDFKWTNDFFSRVVLPIWKIQGHSILSFPINFTEAWNRNWFWKTLGCTCQNAMINGFSQDRCRKLVIVWFDAHMFKKCIYHIRKLQFWLFCMQF